MISFLAPAFFLGALALAVPVLVHLVRRRQPSATAFPSLMFIEQIPLETTQRRRIRDWPLLVLRCLALALMVLAFAEPLINRASAALGIGLERSDRIIVIDRSYSMGYADRFEEARQAALSLLDGLAPADRAGLVVFDSSAQTLSELSSDRAGVRRALAELKSGAGITDLASGIRHAARLLADSDARKREIHLISDFQRNGWTPERVGPLPPGITLSAVVIGADSAPNATLAALEFTPYERGGPERISVAARVLGSRDAGRKKLTVQLDADTQPAQTKPLALAPGAGADAHFDLLRPGRPSVPVLARIDEDRLKIDDRYYAVLHAERALKVLVIESTRARPQQSLFLRRALAVSKSPSFVVEVKNTDALEAADLSAVDVVVQLEGLVLSRAADAAIEAFVAAGGGLLIGAGERAGNASVAGSTGEVVRAEAGLGLRAVEDAHPVFAHFDALREGELSGVRVFGYRELDEAESDQSVLLRFDNGAAALIERRVARGRVLLLATTLDTRWSNLPLTGAYLPLMINMMRHLARYEPAPNAFVVGDALEVGRYLDALPGETPSAPRSAGAVFVKTPSGEEIGLPQERAVLRLAEPGLYEARRSGKRGIIAVNVNSKESDLAPLADVETVIAAIAPANGAPANADELPAKAEPPADDDRIWWYLLIAAAVLLALETLVSNRLRQVPA